MIMRKSNILTSCSSWYLLLVLTLVTFITQNVKLCCGYDDAQQQQHQQQQQQLPLMNSQLSLGKKQQQSIRREVNVKVDNTSSLQDRCRHWQNCLTKDDIVQKKNDNNGRYSSRYRHRHLQSSTSSTSTVKNHRILVVLVKFLDHKDLKVPSQQYFQTLFNGTGKSDINPIGSIREYLRINSVGKYNGTY
jgi:hypothetical protein